MILGVLILFKYGVLEDLIRILPEKRKMESLFNDIPTSSGYFPTFPLDNKMVDGEGVVETVDGINLPYCYGLNLDGINSNFRKIGQVHHFPFSSS